jgi:hypothetical protein
MERLPSLAREDMCRNVNGWAYRSIEPVGRLFTLGPPGVLRRSMAWEHSLIPNLRPALSRSAWRRCGASNRKGQWFCSRRALDREGKTREIVGFEMGQAFDHFKKTILLGGWKRAIGQ